MDLLPIESRWRHYKGGIYVVVGHALREADSATPVLYIDSVRLLGFRAGRILPWSRPLSEWHDTTPSAPRYTRIIT